jgi:Na+/H+ antiporter NhaD/arsenite permease-like protein
MGNATLIAAAANLVVAGISEKTSEKITFRNYLKFGLPTSIFTFVLSMLYIIIRYYVL